MTSSTRAFRPSGPARPAEIAQRPLPASVVGLTPPAPAQSEQRAPRGALLVGPGIHVKGRIEACHALVVEGHVEASLAAASLQVAKGGTFEGTAEVETAQIDGRFEGVLTVRGLLAVAETGRLTGTIRYARIAIEAGGEIAGEVAVADPAETAERSSPADAQEA